MSTSRPIPFSAPMVRAIMAGTKTQTRRVVKPQPTWRSLTHAEGGGGYWRDGKVWTPDMLFRGCMPKFCPYGAPGDTLWVRETWAHKVDGVDLSRPASWYAADFTDRRAAGKSMGIAWRPSIFMPRWASRLTLRITEVRVERLQEISEGDAWAEGVNPPVSVIIPHDAGRRAYAQLWDSINGKTHPWESNPWVWAITFEVPQ